MKDLNITILFDYYGECLTDKQRELFDFYYNEDFSLAEVAQNNAVYDEVLYIKGGLPIFGGSLKPEEKTAIFEWVDRVIANLK